MAEKTAEELQSELEAVLAKNRELLGELKSVKAKARGVEIDPEDFARLQTENEELKTSLSKMERTTKTEMDKLSKALSEKDGALQNYLIDGGITEALAKSGVRPEFVSAAKALLKQQASIRAENGSYQAVMGDKPLNDAITEWIASDGKHFVSAPANAGGGALSNGNGGGVNVNPWAKDSLNLTEQLRIKRESPELAAKLAAQAR